MTDIQRLQLLLHARTLRLHQIYQVQSQQIDLSLHAYHNDPEAVTLLTELFAEWGVAVDQGVFNHHLESQVQHFQEMHGVHPADGIVRHDTWAALATAIEGEISDLNHQMQSAEGGDHHAAGAGGSHDHSGYATHQQAW
jgi:murein L,D-transpeptidase YcbB/YkuD